MNTITIALVDDHHILLDGLKALLDAQVDMSVVGAYTNGYALLKALDEINPDVVILDISMPEIDGIALAKAIKEIRPAMCMLCLSMHDDEEHILAMCQAGAQGYLLKNIDNPTLLEAIRKVSTGEMYFTPDVAHRIAQSSETELRRKELIKEVHLTKRELQILELIAKEYTNARIGAALYISESTVETHRKNMLRKTQHNTMVGLLKFALDNKLI